MKKILLTCIAVAISMISANAKSDSVSVTLQNAHRTLTYKGALVVNGETVTLKDKELSATEGNQIAALVVNGGKLVLDHCTIQKKGDGIRNSSFNKQGSQRPSSMSDMNDQRQQRSNRQGHGGPGNGNGGSGGGGDDNFNFYGLNSAIVVVGEGSSIEMIGCKVTTDAEYANAVFSCDGAIVNITEGITIKTSKGSSRGLYATCAGIVKASGEVNISTQGAHCAALATDRGGGTVTVGKENTTDKSILNTAGEGSPCIYSTGNISAYNATGTAGVSQTMVIEGKNSITISRCQFAGNSPKHGGIMLYQSTSGDADEGTSVLNMKDCTIRDNSGKAMILVTNTHSIVNMENSIFMDSNGKKLTSDYPLITCRNCNADGHNWGRDGNNGGQIELNIANQTLMGTLLANEKESSITVTADVKSDVKGLKIAEGKGTASIR